MDNLQRDQNVTTLFPTTGELAQIEAETDFVQWEDVPSNPIPGSEWTDEVVLDGVRKRITGTLDDYQRDPKPGLYRLDLGPDANKSQLYFNAVKLNTALLEIAHDAHARQWKLEIALRNVRLAVTTQQTAAALVELDNLYNRYYNSADIELKVRMAVNDLANTIDADERPKLQEQNGYSVLGDTNRYYAFRPVWEFIRNVRRSFKRSDS